MRLVFSLSVLISSFSWVILTVLKVDMAMAAIKMPMAINILGDPALKSPSFGQRFYDVAEVFQRSFNGQADVSDVSDGFCNRFERLLMLFQKLIVNSGDGLLGVEYGGKVEKDAYVDVR